MKEKEKNIWETRLESKKVLLPKEKNEIVIQTQEKRKGNNVIFKGEMIGSVKKSIFFKD